MTDYRDFYIKYQGHPKYDASELIEDDIINIVIQKYEMLIYTNKGEVLGDPDFGCDLYKLLYETYVSSGYVEQIIKEQIALYIPELDNINYTLNVMFAEDDNAYQQVMLIYFTITDYEVYSIVKNF